MSEDDYQPEVLEWAERHGIENLKSRIETADILAKEAQHTLTVIIAGVGASLVYAVKAFEPAPTTPVVFGTAALCVYLTLVGIGLVSCTMLMRSIPAVYQDPVNLAQIQFSISELRAKEIKNISERVSQAVKRNERTARFINWARLALVLSPFVFFLAACYRMP